MGVLAVRTEYTVFVLLICFEMIWTRAETIQIFINHKHSLSANLNTTPKIFNSQCFEQRKLHTDSP